jgi:hypothetical protein
MTTVTLILLSIQTKKTRAPPSAPELLHLSVTQDIPSLLWRGLPPKVLPPRLCMQTPKDLPSPARVSTWTLRRGPYSARKGCQRRLPPAATAPFRNRS